MDQDPAAVFASPSAPLGRDPDGHQAVTQPPGDAARPRSLGAGKPRPKQGPMKEKPPPKGSTEPGARPKQTKSRDGCSTCKEKRLKCDERHPSCQNCEKRGAKCGGYEKEFKFKFATRDDFNKKTAPAPKPKRNQRVVPSKHVSSGPRGDASPEILSISPPSANTSFSEAVADFNGSGPSSATFSFSEVVPELQRSGSSSGSEGCDALPQLTDWVDAALDVADAEMLPAINGASLWEMVDYQNDTDLSSMTRSPALLDYDVQRLFPDADAAMDDAADARDEAVEEVVPATGSRVELGQLNLAGLGRPFGSLNRLVFPATAPEMLVRGFDMTTCGILSVRDGPTENPWRNAILPLIHESETLFHAIASMAAFHVSNSQAEMKVVGTCHMQQSIHHLRESLYRMRPDVALASTLALAFAESWDVHVSTGIKHLIGAKYCIERARPLVTGYGPGHEISKRIKFLCNTWVYMDVIARLTSMEAEEDEYFDTVLNLPEFPCADGMEVDPLMGCASSLFPLIGRVANLVRKVRTSAEVANSLSTISAASDLKARIEAWAPPPVLSQPEDEHCGIQDSLHTAEAYRWATLLYLHQAVPEMPSLPAVQLARKALVAMALVKDTSRTTIVHIYPLLAAGCEVESKEDRAWVLERWQAMVSRMLIGNVARCVDIVKEVWHRRDRRATRNRMDQALAAGGKSPALASPCACNSLDNWLDGGFLVAQPAGNAHRARHASFGESQPSLALPYERTVRGSQHWLGVMSEWNWEVLLG